MEEGGCIRGGYRMVVVACDETVGPDPEPGDYITAAQAQAIANASSSQARQQAQAYSDAALSDHASRTTNVHGIADTALLETQSGAQAKVSTHSNDTTNVHGIADTSQLLTQASVDDLATKAELATHAADTTNVHGIADTSALLTDADLDGLATDTDVTNAVSAHSADTTAVHGIVDTAQLATQADLDGFATEGDLTAHVNDTTAVHGIADTAALETTSGAQAKANTAQTNATNAAASALAAHSADTTVVHGIADTSQLETVTGAQGKVDTHAADTTDVHGIADTSALLTEADLSAYATDVELAAHAADTTAVHGITDTSVLETQAGAQAKADTARSDAEGTAASALAGHAADTTNIHGIADTSELLTSADLSAYATDAELAAHASDTTLVHGIADTSVLETTTGSAAKVAAHAADTTDVHGISDTTALETGAGAQAKADAAEADAVAAAATDATTKANAAQAAAESTAATALSGHAADTTAIHGIADTSLLLTEADLADYATDTDVSTAVATHSADTTAIHGIADTSVLETQSGAQAKATAAQNAATTAASNALAAHEADTTNVHGIADTSDLLTSADLDAYATDADLTAHAADTTAVHGITDTAALETQAGAQAKADAAVTSAVNQANFWLNSHEADTTNIHGIADTAALITQTSGDARYLLQSVRGAANGVASLGADTKVPTAQLRLFTLNVRDYGALGDNAANDATAIQAALSAARDAGGGWVIVPPGIYLIGATLRIYSNTRLTLLPGAEFRRNVAATMIVNGDAAQAFGGWTGHGNILIEGGLWNMRGTTSGLTASAMCITIGHARNVTIRDLEVRDVSGFHAIEINSTKIALVENCQFRGYVDPGSRDFSEAIQIDLAKSSEVFGAFGPYDHTVCEDIEVRVCYFGASGTAGTTAWPRGVGSHSATVDTTHRRIRINENTFEGMIQYAVVAYAYDDCVISDNTMVNCGSGIRARTIISADAADSTNTSGVQTNASQTMKNLTITGNVVRGTGASDDAILLFAETTGHIVGATIDGNVVDTVSATENGIRVLYADQYTVSDNTVRGVGGTGISQEQVTGGVVTGNRIYQTTASGISCDTGTNMKIDENTIQEVGVNGVHILGGTDVTVSDNDIKGASRTTNLAGYGIRASTSCDGLRMVGNKVRLFGSGNEVGYGAGITSTCTNVTRFGNDLRGATAPLDDQSSLPLTTPWDAYDSLEEVMRPAGRWETRSRMRSGTANAPTSGTLTLVPIWLPRGVTLSNLGFSSGSTAGVSLTNQWFMLLNNARVALARTADATTAAWAANTAKSLAIAQTTAGAASSYVTTYAGLHYLGVMIAAATVPTLAGEGTISAVHTTAPGFGATNTGQTTPPTVTAGAFTAAAFGGTTAPLLYGYAT